MANMPKIGMLKNTANAVKRSTQWYSDVAKRSTRNPNSNKFVLGHYSPNGGVSYQKVATHYKATYFKMDNWKEVTKGMTDDQIWTVNKTFIRQQIDQGKRILFSHDPKKARPGSFFKNEVNMIMDITDKNNNPIYKIVKINQFTWEAVKR